MTEEQINDLKQFLQKQGYSIDFDEDGLWTEDYVSEHRWKDVFELMEEYHNQFKKELKIHGSIISESKPRSNNLKY